MLISPINGDDVMKENCNNDVKIKLSQAFIPYDTLIHKKKFLDFISPLAEHLRVSVITVVVMATHVAPLYSLLYGGLTA